MKKVFLAISALFLAFSLGTGCSALTGDDEGNDGLGLLLLFAASQQNNSQTSGFLITIPNGVAK